MPITTAEYQQMDATALAGALRRGDVGAGEVLEVCIGLIEARNPELNGVIHRCFDHAREQLARLAPEAPFAGVPLLLKDLGHHLAGTPLTAGNAALRDRPPISTEDSELVRRLRRGGFVIPGKTNVPEFGLLGTTEPEAFGPSRNPWDKSRSPGGSSGGSAAMVAAGVVPVATANDGGGSIRIPASYCGLVGLKPSRGLVSNAPHYDFLWDGFNSDMALTRSTRDAAAVLGLLAGGVRGDACAAPALPAEIDLMDFDTAAPPPPMHIAVCTRPPLAVPVDDCAVTATHAMARLLESMGHRVEEAEPDISGEAILDVFAAPYMAAAAADYAEVRARYGSAARRGTEAQTRFLAYLGRCLNGAQYMAASRRRNDLSRTMARFLAHYDLYLTPTTAGVAHQLGATSLPGTQQWLNGLVQALGLGRWVLGSAVQRKGFMAAVARVPFTQLANICGLPAISIPAFHDRETGLPVGVMLTAPLGSDVRLLQLARQVELAVPWGQHYPFMGGAGAAPDELIMAGLTNSRAQAADRHAGNPLNKLEVSSGFGGGPDHIRHHRTG